MRRYLLAAEIFGYSYAHYAERLFDGHVRFSEVMPRAVPVLARAVREGWDDVRLAKALDVPVEEAESYRQAYCSAREILDAPSPAESLRRGVRQSIRNALQEGLTDESAIEDLVEQICYRVADFIYLVDLEGSNASDYSEELRFGSSVEDHANGPES